MVDGFLAAWADISSTAKRCCHLLWRHESSRSVVAGLGCRRRLAVHRAGGGGAVEFGRGYPRVIGVARLGCSLGRSVGSGCPGTSSGRRHIARSRIAQVLGLRGHGWRRILVPLVDITASSCRRSGLGMALLLFLQRQFVRLADEAVKTG